MTKHKDINIPVVDKWHTFLKVITVIAIPAAIIAFPLFYGQEPDLENILTAIVVLFGVVYVVFFLMNK